MITKTKIQKSLLLALIATALSGCFFGSSSEDGENLEEAVDEEQTTSAEAEPAGETAAAPESQLEATQSETMDMPVATEQEAAPIEQATEDVSAAPSEVPAEELAPTTVPVAADGAPMAPEVATEQPAVSSESSAGWVVRYVKQDGVMTSAGATLRKGDILVVEIASGKAKLSNGSTVEASMLSEKGVGRSKVESDWRASK